MRLHICVVPLPNGTKRSLCFLESDTEKALAFCDACGFEFVGVVDRMTEATPDGPITIDFPGGWVSGGRGPE